MVDRSDLGEWARHLVLLSKEVREAGDMGQVLLSEDGVSTAMPLSDRLYYIACGLDVEAAADEGTRLLAEHSAAWETDCVFCNGRIHVGDAVRIDNGFTIHEECS